MTAPVPHDHYEQLVAGLALSALEPGDEQEVLRHLASCTACQRELADARGALAHLAELDDAAEPPPALWAGIRAAVEAESPRAFVPPAPREAEPEARAVPQRAGSGSAVLDLGEARRRRAARRVPRAAAWTSVAACLALVVGLGTWNLTLRQDRDERGDRADRLAAAVRTLETAPARTVPLTSTAGVVQAMAVVQADRVSLVVDGLAPNDTATSTYVLWGQKGNGSPTALGSFDVSRQRGGSVQVVRDLPLTPAGQPAPDLLLVTREAGRTAPAATKQPALAAGRTA